MTIKISVTLGLVMWEVVYRIQRSVSIGPSYQPPYWDLVGVDPSLDEMRKVNIDQSEMNILLIIIAGGVP